MSETGPSLTVDQKEKIVMVSGRTHTELAELTADYIGVKLFPTILGRHEDGELKVQIDESVRGKHVYVHQAHYHQPDFSIDSAISEHRFLVASASRGDAEEVTASATYWGYSRSDRKSKPREPTGSAITMADFEQFGPKRLMGFDLHSQPTQSFFRGVFVQMTAFLNTIKSCQN